MTMSNETLITDFKVAVCGMSTAGQWFSQNADTTNNPLLLLTSGVLHEVFRVLLTDRNSLC